MANNNSPMAGIPSHVEMGSLEEHSVIDLEDECLINHGSIDGRTKPPQRYNSVALCLEDSGWEHIWKIVLSRTKVVFFSNKINLLVPCGPLAILVDLFTGHQGSVFLLSLLGTIPLAERLGWITEQLAFYTGPTVGGLLNATFGNATELIISIHAMKSGLLRVVQQSLLGSILSNMLLVLGSAFFIGGISHSNKQQVFNKANAEMNSGLLLMAVMGLMFPAVLHVTHTELHYGKSELALSRFSSCVMLVAYAAYLFFQLKSQRNLYGTINEEESQADGSLVDEEAPEITKWESIIWLFILTMWISFLSEYLVNAIEFEEKLVKFHIEKKEQELTAQNAQTHQQKLSSLENFVVAKNGEESAESDIVEDETDADVSDPSVEGMDQSSHNVSKSKVELDEHSQASSEVTELEPCENKVQSPMIAISSKRHLQIKSQEIQHESSKSETRMERSLDLLICITRHTLVRKGKHGSIMKLKLDMDVGCHT